MKPIKEEVMPIIPWKTGNRFWNELIWYYPINITLDRIKMLIRETLKNKYEKN